MTATLELDDETADSIQSSIDAAIEDADADVDVEAPSAGDINSAYQEARQQWNLPAGDESERYIIDELAGSLADTAQGIHFGDDAGGNRGHVQLDAIDEHHDDVQEGDGAWLDVKAVVLTTWDNDSDAIFRKLLVGDDTGRARVTIFQNAADELGLSSDDVQEGDAFWLRNVVTERFNGNVELKVTTAADVEPVDYDPEVPEDLEEFTAQVVDINDASGLIRRCPNDDCSYVMEATRCPQHGRMDGVEYDLRLKLQVDTGLQTFEFIVPREETAALTGINLEEAKALAEEAADHTVVGEKMTQALHGKTVHGQVNRTGDVNLVRSIGVLEVCPDPDGVLQDLRAFDATA